MIREVVLSAQAIRNLRRVPRHIAERLYAWVDAVRALGLEAVRMRPGHHDEPLKGPRQGQRSIRLSRSYRAIYVLRADGQIEVVVVKEVTRHDY